MSHHLSIPISGADADLLSQLEYSLSFVSEDIVSYKINDEAAVIEVELSSDAARDSVQHSIEGLIERYQAREFGLPKAIEFCNERELPVFDAWSELLARKWVTPVGQGHVVLRGDAARLLSFIDAKVSAFARSFNAELECVPATISSRTLDRINHFTSFPEHIDFVSHIKSDLDVLNSFAAECGEHGWSPARHEHRMAENDFAICPSCCYHCYEAMEEWQLEAPGRCITTSAVACHRYEGANHRTMTRLRAFSQRDVVWVGHPRFVIEGRAKAEEMIVQWAKDWELVGTFETANDMFFTKDYAVKASFQRQQQAKKELRLMIPFEKQSISVSSSNFHATTFGKAFNITVGGRPATSACFGWGYERWAFAVFSQFGLDWRKWPGKLRDEFAAHITTSHVQG